MKLMSLILSVALAAFLGAGCGKPAAPSARPALPYALTSQTVAHFHWLGKKQLAATTNAANVMRIWDMPESAALETQVLDKLSTAPWRLLPHVATTNAAAAPLLRALLDDCVQAESYLEIRAATNQPGELAFAIRLPAARAAVWQTNLATVLESLTGLQATPSQPSTLNPQLPHRYQLPSGSPGYQPSTITYQLVGDWLIIGLGQDRNALAGDFTARILRNHTPLLQASADFWVDARVDLRRVTEAFKLDWKLPAGWPEVSVHVAGDGKNVKTRGKLDFPTPLKLDLEPWQIPVSLVHPPISSFTAVRGVKPWLATLKVWNDLQIGTPPNQLFCWALQGASQLTFFAIPLQDASNRVAQVSDLVMEQYGPCFATNEFFSFKKSKTFNGLDWSGYPYLTPHFQSITTSEGEFAYGELFPRPPSQRPPPPELIKAILGQTNLVYYNWELTGQRNDQWLYIGQFFRLVLLKAQLPNAACVAWFKATERHLDASLTAVAKTGPEQLSFMRDSSIGFSSVELHLLADWLESPQFPRGLHTLLAPTPPLKAKRPMPSAKR